MPSSAGADPHAGGVAAGNGTVTDQSTTPTALCCLLGATLAAGLGAFLLPALVAVTRPLETMASTVVIATVLVVWLVAWMLIESAWAFLST